MNRNRQTGIALITVLLVLALASVAAVAMTTRQQLDIRRTTNILQIEQAYMAMQGFEELAKRVLIADDNKTDSMKDIWATISNDKSAKLLTIADFQLVDVTFEDLHGRFNINNLINASDSLIKVNRDRFIRLLDSYALPAELANAAIDWIDANPDTMPDGGAEDSDYSVMVSPYTTPQRLMASASEMNRLMGVNLPHKDDVDGIHLRRRKEIWKMIFDEKVLTALPLGTTINVNTVASPEIYMALVKDLSADKAQSIFDKVHGREDVQPEPFDSVEAFFTQAGADGTKDNINMQLDVKSEYFLFRVTADNQQLTIYLNTILRRIGIGDGATVHVVHRSFGKLGEI